MFNKKLLIIVLLVALGGLSVSVQAAPIDPIKPLEVSGPDATPCPDPDPYEGDGGGERDDFFDTASTLTEAGQPDHTFDRYLDKDWARFEAQEGATYTIATTNLTPPFDPAGFFADTVLELYADDGVTLLDYSDDFGGGYASRIVWQAPEAGTYYVKVYNYNGQVFGCDVGYDLVWVETESLAIDKAAQDLDGEPLEAGDTIRYTVTITNPDPLQAATGVVVTDHIPTGTSYVPDSVSVPPGSLVLPISDTLVVNVGTLGPAAVFAFTFDVTVDAGVSEIGGNYAEVSGDGLEQSSVGPVYPPGGGSVSPGEDVLALTKMAEDVNGSPLQPGDEILYTVVLTNLLDSPQTNVVITDYIPTYTTYVAGSAATSQGSVSGPDPLVVEVGSLAGEGVVTFTFRVTVDMDAGGQEVVNQAMASSDQQVPAVSTPPVTTPGGGTVVVPGEYFIYLPIVKKGS
jgi:uncharacterized repeat protein (TIGR01451 family)